VDAFATVDDGEIWLRGLHIAEYEMGTWTNHEPRRNRKLLLHKGEILKLIGKTKESGLSLVPLSMYFKDGKVKVELALAKGKKSLRQAARPRQAGRRPGDHQGCGALEQGPSRLAARLLTSRSRAGSVRWACPAWSTCTCTSCPSR